MKDTDGHMPPLDHFINEENMIDVGDVSILVAFKKATIHFCGNNITCGIDDVELVYENISGSFVQYGYIEAKTPLYTARIAINKKSDFIALCKFMLDKIRKKPISRTHDGAPNFPEFNYD